MKYKRKTYESYEILKDKIVTKYYFNTWFTLDSRDWLKIYFSNFFLNKIVWFIDLEYIFISSIILRFRFILFYNDNITMIILLLLSVDRSSCSLAMSPLIISTILDCPQGGFKLPQNCSAAAAMCLPHTGWVGRSTELGDTLKMIKSPCRWIKVIECNWNVQS